MFEISSDMVLQKLQDLNPGKIPGPDSWYPIFLKNLAGIICKPLAILFHKSLYEGFLPADWKKACVTAILKKGQNNLPDNYRPVSMTSIICKLMESILKEKIIQHMTENN